MGWSWRDPQAMDRADRAQDSKRMGTDGHFRIPRRCAACSEWSLPPKPDAPQPVCRFCGEPWRDRALRLPPKPGAAE
jgi:hypothetical protein